MLAYRYGFKAFCGTKIDAFGGQGGIEADGRWHIQPIRITYASTHPALALLEILVHLKKSDHARPIVYWVIDIPDRHIEKPKLGDLPQDWRTNENSTRAHGNEWLLSHRSVCLVVPSVIVPIASNILINPGHPDFELGWVQGNAPQPAVMDRRLI
jgi:RES domain-containing protein